MRGCACGDRDGVASGNTGIAHVSCLAEQAKILVAEAVENNLDAKVFHERWTRWDGCSLCKQHYHGVVKCALGWACWKTYVGRPEADETRRSAMRQVANGLSAAYYHEDALTVEKAQLSTLRRHGALESDILGAQGNLAITYQALGRFEEALQMKWDVYTGYLKLHGEQYGATLIAANNYAWGLVTLERFDEAKSLMRKSIRVARRALGENVETTLRMRWTYAAALYRAPGATLDDLREAVTTLEVTERIARRVLGGSHPRAMSIERGLRSARAALRARETPPPPPPAGSG